MTDRLEGESWQTDKVLIEDLKAAAKMPNGASFKTMVDEAKRIYFPHAINVRTNQISGIDLAKLPPEISYGVVAWLCHVNRRRIEENKPIVATYEILKRCPMWKYVDIPYIIKNLKDPKASSIQTTAETEQSLGGINKKK